jgi:hypothetical protein
VCVGGGGGVLSVYPLLVVFMISSGAYKRTAIIVDD